MVEAQYMIRERLVDPFVRRLWAPIYKRFAAAALRHGHVRPGLLRNVDPATFTHVQANPRGIAWIDMLKEVQAEAAAVQAGFKSRHQVIRERGLDPRQVDAKLDGDTRAQPTAQPPAQNEAMNDE